MLGLSELFRGGPKTKIAVLAVQNGPILTGTRTNGPNLRRVTQKILKRSEFCVRYKKFIAKRSQYGAKFFGAVPKRSHFLKRIALRVTLYGPILVPRVLRDGPKNEKKKHF